MPSDVTRRCITTVLRNDAWQFPSQRLCTGAQCPLKGECDAIIVDEVKRLNSLSLAIERFHRLRSGCG
jgi:hypothetical protein